MKPGMRSDDSIIEGMIARHSRFGLGRIVGLANRRVRVHFFGHEGDTEFGADAAKSILLHATLLPGTPCESSHGHCTIVRRAGGGADGALFQYEVKYDSGLAATVSEHELTPLPREQEAGPLELLKALDQQGYALFAAREALRDAVNRVVRDGSGVRAMLSARIDLRPHQAYVSGVVLLDPKRRYILADEVGLGKTIEAGIIIHDLLSKKPAARILVLCPGALTHQWLCELYSKFGGRVFRLLDLHHERALEAMDLQTAIVSMSLAVRGVAQKLASVEWDMVVVDEAHHLLVSESLYQLVGSLSRRSPSVLLLSALPAQRREDEFLRLLELLEPGRYSDANARAAFQSLFASQQEIGRRLRILSRRIDDLTDEQGVPDEVVRAAQRLLESPVIANDQHIAGRVTALEPMSSSLAAEASAIRRDVADRYRINRRILRNRRSRLIEEGQIRPVQRELRRVAYRADQIELEAIQGVEGVLAEASSAGAPPEVLAPFSRLALQALAGPSTTAEFLGRLDQHASGDLNEAERDFLAISHMAGYADFALCASLACRAIRPYLTGPTVSAATHRARAWKGSRAGSMRMRELIRLLRTMKQADPLQKIIIFAGYPGLTPAIHELLAAEFGPSEVEQFRHDMKDDAKEESVRRFQSSKTTWLLVSDETGGEGRNFQYASEIVHFDTPWNAARVEQRIGRLDRLGREAVRPDVRSNVIYCVDSPEAGLLDCYESGLRIYQQSISGLEFALRGVEQSIAMRAAEGGAEALEALSPELRTTADEERARDESEAVLDEASFDRDAAERFRRVSRAQEAEAELEQAFARYVTVIAGASKLQDGIWRFSTDAKYGKLPLANEQPDDGSGTAKGTFRRAIAQTRPDLQFFSVGNPFFDAVVASLGLHPTGRSYSVAVADAARERWAGFEFVFVARPKVDTTSVPGLVNRASEAFPERAEHVFVRIDGHVEADGPSLLATRRSLKKDEKERSWWNLTKDKAADLPDILGVDWEATVADCYERAASAAREALTSRVAEALDSELARLSRVRESIVAGAGADASDEIAGLEALETALRGWEVVLDGVGFLGINVTMRGSDRVYI